VAGVHRAPRAGRLRPLTLAAAAFVLGFAYSLPAVRDGLFPYRQLASLHALLGERTPGGSAREAPVPGRWRPWRPRGRAGELTPEQEAEIRELMAIGYVAGSKPAPAVAGVIVHDRAKSCGGPNLVVSGHGPVAYLMDMDGRVLHQWTYDFWDVWPNADVPARDPDTQFWRRAHVFENGDLLAIYDWLGLIKLDKDSNLLWAYPGTCHHDLWVADDGTIYTLEQEAAVIPRINPTRPVLVDFIAVLSPGGRLIRRVPLLEAFERSNYAALLHRMRPAGDVFHTNTIEVLDGRLALRSPAFREGNVLVCVRNIETIAVVDLDAGSVVWALAGRWSRQHQPTVLDNGHMLVFNNEAGADAVGEPVSEVIEIDPFTQEVFWSYRGGEDGPLYSATCGSNQRLSNGNTLITESDNGRAFEVTPDKEIVWEFVSPYRAGEHGELIATLLEVERLPSDFPLGWLGGPRDGESPGN